MTIRPILFSGPMVRALLEGRKTQTRRVLDLACDEPPAFIDNGEVAAYDENDRQYRWPRTATIGDLLYVRESWRKVGPAECGCSEHCLCPEAGAVLYMATQDDGESSWKPSIHMRRSASRITLKVDDVRVQRLQDITEQDAKAEGPIWADGPYFPDGVPGHMVSEGWRSRFAHLWDGINSTRGFGWVGNPWVVAYSFTVHRCNVDAFKDEAAA